MGYFRTTEDFNIGKMAEFKERKWYTEKKLMSHYNDVVEVKNAAV